MPIPDNAYPYPALERISDYVAFHADRVPEALAAVSGERRTTFQDLASEVDSLARALLNAGVGKGDRVATLCAPSIEFLTTFLATTSIGAIWVGLNPKYQAEELQYVISDAQPSMLFARTEIAGRSYLDPISAMQSAAIHPLRTIFLDERSQPRHPGEIDLKAFLNSADGTDAEELSAARQSVGGRQACMIVYTSGSTGKPKGALLHHAGVIRFSRLQNRYWPMEPLRMLNYLPINHVGSVVDISTPCLVHGGTIIFSEEFSPKSALQLTADEEITALASVPSALQMMLDSPHFDDFDLAHLQMAIWEGGAMSPDWIRRLHAVCPRLATNYGMTETTSAITIVEPTEDFELLENSVGFPIEGSEVRIVDPDTGVEVQPGTSGEIQVRSPNNMLGYWQKPEETAKVLLADGFLRTGDLGYFRPDHSICLSGRLKEMFKSGGYNVYPAEIESVLEAHPSVTTAVVVSVPDSLWAEVGFAFIVGPEEIDTAKLEAWCRERLANYKVPKHFEVIDSMPLLPIGKVDKVSLQTTAEQSVSAAGEKR